jgi:hypothetical protein
VDTSSGQINDLQGQVSSMAAEIDVICNALAKSNPSAIAPNACVAP